MTSCIGKAFVISRIMMGNTSFAVATAAHSKVTVAGTEVGVSVGRSIPEKGICIRLLLIPTEGSKV